MTPNAAYIGNEYRPCQMRPAVGALITLMTIGTSDQRHATMSAGDRHQATIAAGDHTHQHDQR